jgi:RES domain-containing protein
MKTVSVYRMVKSKWAATAFDGDGARITGGRWNSKGVPCVYTSASESLALLEMLVHLQDASLRRYYTVFELQIPENLIAAIPEDKLPSDWQQPLAPPSTAVLGDEWLKSASLEMALAIPSTIVPREMNYLLKIGHPEYRSTVSRAKQMPFYPDPRLA